MIIGSACSTRTLSPARVRVSEEGSIVEDGSIVITAELPANQLLEASIAVGRKGPACRISTGDNHRASALPDAPEFEGALEVV